MKDGKLNDGLYFWLKWLCIIVLPALSSLVAGLSKIWGFEDVGASISQTIILIATFLGTVLCISNYNYYKKGNNNADS